MGGGALRQPQSLGLAREEGRGHSVGQRRPRLGLQCLALKAPSRIYAKRLSVQATVGWRGGGKRRPGVASSWVAMLAAGKA